MGNLRGRRFDSHQEPTRCQYGEPHHRCLRTADFREADTGRFALLLASDALTKRQVGDAISEKHCRLRINTYFRLSARVFEVLCRLKEFLKLLLRHKGPAGRPDDVCCLGEMLADPLLPTKRFTLGMPDNEARTGGFVTDRANGVDTINDASAQIHRKRMAGIGEIDHPFMCGIACSQHFSREQ